METRRPAPPLARAELRAGDPLPPVQGLFSGQAATVRIGETEGMGARTRTREVSVGADGIPVVQCRGGAEEGACDWWRWEMVAGA